MPGLEAKLQGLDSNSAKGVLLLRLPRTGQLLVSHRHHIYPHLDPISLPPAQYLAQTLARVGRSDSSSGSVTGLHHAGCSWAGAGQEPMELEQHLGG